MKNSNPFLSCDHTQALTWHSTAISYPSTDGHYLIISAATGSVYIASYIAEFKEFNVLRDSDGVDHSTAIETAFWADLDSEFLRTVNKIIKEEE